MADYHELSPRALATEGGEVEAGASGGAHCIPISPLARRWASHAAIGPGSAGVRFFFDSGLEDEPRHFLDACYLCNKPLGRNRDIYMYRGDTPFCSEECRQEQIEMDEAREKSRSLTMKVSASRKEQQQQKLKENTSSQGIKVPAGGAVVAV